MQDDKIKILFLGERYHVRVFVEHLKKYCSVDLVCEGAVNNNDIARIEEYDLIHLISSPLSLLKKLSRYEKPIIYHWIGTDVFRLIKDSELKRWAKKRLIKRSNVINLVVSDLLQKELLQEGINSEMLPLVSVYEDESCHPLPSKFSVLCYLPETRWDFYNGDLVIELAKRLPEVDFHIVASEKNVSELKNVVAHGYVDDMKPLYNQSSVLLRFTVHDGLSKMVLEALSNCRHVIWNQPFAHCYFASNISECQEAIQSLKDNPSLNLNGKEFVNLNYNPGKISNDYLDIVKGLVNQK